MNFIILIFVVSFCLPENCPKSKPILYNDECIIRSCSEEDINNHDCTIANEIIEIQWMNKIITNQEKRIYKVDSIINNNELILSSIVENSDGTNSFLLYSLNNNNQLNLNEINTLLEIFYSDSITIQSLLIEINNKYYILSCFEIQCNLINYSNKEEELIFGEDEGQYFSMYNVLFISNDNFNYYFGNVIESYDNLGYLILKKFNFSYIEEDNNIQVKEENKRRRFNNRANAIMLSNGEKHYRMYDSW